MDTRIVVSGMMVLFLSRYFHLGQFYQSDGALGSYDVIFLFSHIPHRQRDLVAGRNLVQKDASRRRMYLVYN